MPKATATSLLAVKDNRFNGTLTPICKGNAVQDRRGHPPPDPPADGQGHGVRIQAVLEAVGSDQYFHISRSGTGNKNKK